MREEGRGRYGSYGTSYIMYCCKRITCTEKWKLLRTYWLNITDYRLLVTSF